MLMSDQAHTHIIIVNYNAGNWLQRSINSALKFSAGPVTVVDNASSDSSVKDAQASIQDARLKWQINNDNLGFAAANNQVLKEVESEFAVLMNPDCELDDTSIQPILDAMHRDSSIGLASGRICNEDGSLQATCRRRFPTPWSAFVRLFKLNKIFPNSPKFADFDYGDFDCSGIDSGDSSSSHGIENVEAISGAFMFARMSAVKQVGLLDEAYFMHCEDLDWCKRFELGGYKVAFVPSAKLIHAKGVSSRSRPIRVLYTLHKGMNRFYDKFYRDQYSFVLRYVVKLGIVASFCARALLSLFRR